jgi:hypothetical protein
MNFRRSLWIIVCLALQLSIGVPADAHLYCVDNAADLNNDLFIAASSSEDNTIRVQAGTYVGGFNYTRLTGNFSLDLEGGWDAGCATQATDASLTVLDGNNFNSILGVITAAGTGNVTIRYFNFLHGSDQFGNSALYASSYDGDLHVENCRFRLNYSLSSTDVVAVVTHNGTAYFLNNIIADNSASHAYFIFDFQLAHPSDATGMLNFNNNTVADNTLTSDALFGAVHVFQNSNASLANNILWGNGVENEVYTCCTKRALLLDNDFDAQHVLPDPASSGNIKANPLFKSLNNHHVDDTSAVINAGNNAPAGTTGTIDLGGDPRVVFGSVDMGAYEVQDLIFAHAFEAPAIVWIL